MVLRQFERRLESLVEGAFARVFKGGLTPLEIGRRISREIDSKRIQTADQSISAPNHFWVYVSRVDFYRFASVSNALCAELADAAMAHISDEGYEIGGPVAVELVEAENYPEGAFEVRGEHLSGPMTAPSASLVLSDNRRVKLPTGTFTVGRLSMSSLVLPDASASRTHAVLRPASTCWTVKDLGSTNGTRVNGQPVSEVRLRHGDRIVFGSTEVTFELD